jgi:hypothetical protein
VAAVPRRMMLLPVRGNDRDDGTRVPQLRQHKARSRTTLYTYDGWHTDTHQPMSVTTIYPTVPPLQKHGETPVSR